MSQIEKDVKKIILKLAGFNRGPEDLANQTTLDDLGLDDPLCAKLANRLRNYLQIHNASGTIDHMDISIDLSVGDTIKLVKEAYTLTPFHTLFAPLVYKITSIF